MRWTRRQCLVIAATATLTSCANVPTQAHDRIVDAATGAPLTPGDVVNRLRESDIVLLGELHDNPHHHERRAWLLAGIGTPLTVVAEHLPRGGQLNLPVDPSAEALRVALEADGFDAKGWRWPLHEALFMAIARRGHRLMGGNLDRETARRLAREGAGSMPAELASWIDAAPLSTSARAALEQDLQQGHCGQLSPARTPGMVAAQRGRDAAMAQALISQMERRPLTAEHQPVILLAGNGHVRRDYGVPTLLGRRVRPAQVLSIGFLEPTLAGSSSELPFDISWITPAASRDDPCKAWPAVRAASA